MPGREYNWPKNPPVLKTKILPSSIRGSPGKAATSQELNQRPCTCQGDVLNLTSWSPISEDPHISLVRPPRPKPAQGMFIASGSYSVRFQGGGGPPEKVGTAWGSNQRPSICWEDTLTVTTLLHLWGSTHQPIKKKRLKLKPGTLLK